MFRLAGFKRNLVECFELLIGSGEPRFEVSHIELNALSTKDLTYVLDVDRDGVLQFDDGVLVYYEVTVFKAGIRQTMPKGKPRLG